MYSYVPFPLTLALSLREREPRRPSLKNTKGTGIAGSLATVLLLPKGEGRGEGEADVQIRIKLGIERVRHSGGKILKLSITGVRRNGTEPVQVVQASKRTTVRVATSPVIW